MAPKVLLAQLTDTHVLADDPASIDVEVFVDNNARLAAAVQAIGDEPVPVAAVIGTGDLTNDGRQEEYDALRARIESIVDRWWPLPGNHDVPDRVRATFPETPWADTDHASWVADIEGVRVVGLDSTRRSDGDLAHGGEIDEGRAEWLDTVLAEAHDGATLLAMHHPPFASGVWWMDRDGFPGLELLREVLSERPVERIICGHLHRAIGSSFAGIPAQVGRSTVQHVGGDLRPNGDVTVVLDPAGYQVLQVGPDAFGGRPSVVVHDRYIDPTTTPIVPSWASDYT